MSEDTSGRNMTRQCPQCGTPLPAGALEGLCPACLLRQGASTETVAGDVHPFEPPSVSEVARLFPHLEILTFIGKGGMGAVYKARQPSLDRIVALKMLPPQAANGPAFAERFAREARALAKLNHPNIVAVYEFGQVNGMPFFLMEFVDGLNLRELEHAGKLSPREALKIVPQICEALQFAHDEGVVHRDIKPENILLDKKGRVKIADFGIAKIMGAGAPDAAFEPGTPASAMPHSDQARLTEEGKTIGTPNYMAPEQVETPQSVDHRADIFSLGVVFYEMLTGELPLGKFAPPSSRARGVTVDVRLDEVVLRALEREPERRYQQASQVKSAVETITGPPGGPQMPAAPRLGIDYRSRATLFGLPLVHIATGIDPATGRARIARGIIAIGGMAQGVVAFGGVAMGGLTFGGVSQGVIAFGGVAMGVVSVGGFAIALLLALGGGAIAPIAVGGGAIGYFAYGGGVVGVHPLGSNAADDVARHFFQTWVGHLLASANIIFAILLAIMMIVVLGVPIWLRRMTSIASAPSPAQPAGFPAAYRIGPTPTPLSIAAIIFSGSAGILGVVCFCLFPQPPGVLVWSILFCALAGVALGIASRRNSVGRQALIMGAINVAIWVIIATVFWLLAADANLPAAKNLVGIWEAEGNANDSSPNGNNGILRGGAGFVNGKVGQSFNFDGVSGTVMVPDSSSLCLTNQLTIGAWINTPTTKGDQAIVSKVSITTGNNGYQFDLHGDQLTGAFNTPGDVDWPTYYVQTPIPIVPGTWNHVAWTYDNSAMKLYFNGLPVATNVVGPRTISVTSTELRISGADNHVFFNGMIDEVSVYNTALSAAQIQALYKLGGAGRHLPLPSVKNTTLQGGPPAAQASAEAWSPDIAPGQKPDLQKILDDAKELMNQGRYEDSLQRHIWYFNHSKSDPAQAGVRLSFALSYWEELGRRYPKAREALVEIRDHETAEIENGHGYSELVQELQAINHTLNGDDATYSLFLTIRTKDPQLAAQCYLYLEDLLVSKGEYQWCYDHMGDPQMKFNLIHQNLDMLRDSEKRMSDFRQRTVQQTAELNKQRGITNMPPFSPPDTTEMMNKMAHDNFVGKTCQLIEILVATGHQADAENIREQAVGILDDPRLHSAVADAQKRIQDRLENNTGAATGPAQAGPGVTLAAQPPVVVETQPASGARDAAPGETDIRVRFSKEMMDGNWSWTTAGENSSPEIIGLPHYESDNRTCVLKVKLDPGKTYCWWLNSAKFHGFADQFGHPAVPYLLIFQTKSQ